MFKLKINSSLTDVISAYNEIIDHLEQKIECKHTSSDECDCKVDKEVIKEVIELLENDLACAEDYDESKIVLYKAISKLKSLIN